MTDWSNSIPAVPLPAMDPQDHAGNSLPINARIHRQFLFDTGYEEAHTATFFLHSIRTWHQWLEPWRCMDDEHWQCHVRRFIQAR